MIDGICDCSGYIHLSVTMETGGTWSFIWSIERIPLQIMSALVLTKLGKTNPGQSHSIKSSVT